MFGILDLGKRERKTVANYNENKLYADQVAAMKGSKPKERKKKKPIRLPKSLRLPRMEEWQMFNRTRLLAIQEEEETSFRALPEEIQTAATAKKKEAVKDENIVMSDKAVDEVKMVGDEAGNEKTIAEEKSIELPPLLSEEVQEEKNTLLQKGFLNWSRVNYTSFIKASAKYGRSDTAKIASEVGKSEVQVIEYSNAFWGEIGKEQFSEHEYNRVSNLVAKGEKKLADIKALRRGVKVFISLFDNPWEKLQFTHVNTKDKLFSADNDRYLLCWTHKYGIGQWSAIKMAIRRSPQFRFDYFFRSLPVDVIGRRCETLMKAALKEVEFLEKKVREDMGLPAEASEGVSVPPITLPKFKDIQKNNRAKKMAEREIEKKSLEEKVETLEQQIEEIQNRLKQLSKDPDSQKKKLLQNGDSFTKEEPSLVIPVSPPTAVVEESIAFDETKGAIGPEGDYVEFPDYDGSETPKEPRKAFAQFCQRTRKSVKNSLEPQDRRNKEKVNGILRARFTALSDEERHVYRGWASWDKLRHARDLEIFEKGDSRNDTTDEQSQTPKKKRSAPDSLASVPKKKKL